jgi:preprotein translocase subunit SecY
MIIVTAGTILLMWLGELISERKIGNGISLLIFAGIIAAVPQALSGIAVNFDRQQLTTLIMFAAVAVITVIGVVIITEGKRQIPVQYAKQVRGAKMYGGSSTHLPLRVNQAGVIPIIFAISMLMFPTLIARFMVVSKTEFIVKAGQAIIGFFENQMLYGVLYFLLVFAFTYFYTAVIFRPQQVAENLQKSGGFIPGVRPGKHTEEYLQHTITRITATGALFLALIAVLPLILKSTTGLQSMAIGGTSILIVVSVAIESLKQIEAQMAMRDYDTF